MKHILLASFLFLSLLFSCKDKDKNNTGETTDITTEQSDDSTKDSTLLGEYKVLKDSLNWAWKTYKEKEDIIIENLEHSLKHIAYSPSHSATTHAKLSKDLEKVKAKRYDQMEFSSADIDSFDLITDKLILNVINFAQETEDVSKTVVDGFINEINEVNGRLVHYRAGYDAYAMAYNDFIEENREALIASGVPEEELQKAPIFTIMEESKAL